MNLSGDAKARQDVLQLSESLPVPKFSIWKTSYTEKKSRSRYKLFFIHHNPLMWSSSTPTSLLCVFPDSCRIYVLINPTRSELGSFSHVRSSIVFLQRVKLVDRTRKWVDVNIMRIIPIAMSHNKRRSSSGLANIRNPLTLPKLSPRPVKAW